MESKKEFIVGQQDTAAVLGSGGLDVLATPRLVAMVENTCWEAHRAHAPADGRAATRAYQSFR